MSELVQSGRLVEVALALVCLEAVALMAIVGRRRGLRASALDILPNLASGGMLMLALRAALVNAGWIWIVAFLSGALAAHGTDLWRRWRGLSEKIAPPDH